MEVLIGAVSDWGAIEVQVLFPALEAVLEGSEESTAPARERLNTLHTLQNNMHEDEAAEGPYNALARGYIDAVKYHLVVDVQDIVPLAAQLPEREGSVIAQKMATLKAELE